MADEGHYDEYERAMMYLKELEEVIKDLRELVGDIDADITVKCGEEKYHIDAIVLTHFSYSGKQETTNMIDINLRRVKFNT